jgi:hypothetical protein
MFLGFLLVLRSMAGLERARRLGRGTLGEGCVGICSRGREMRRWVRSRMAVGFELRVGRGMPAAWRPCRFPFIRGKEGGPQLQMDLWSLDLAGRTDTAHGKLLVLAQNESQSTAARVGLPRFSSAALLAWRSSGASATDPISRCGVPPSRRRRLSPYVEGVLLLVSRMGGTEESCCPSSFCSFP